MSTGVGEIAAALGELPGEEPWRGAVLARATALQRALRAGDESAIVVAAAALGGLGEGSTPAGDDYLVGVTHGLWWMSRVAPGGRGQAPPLHPERVAEAAAVRTTSLSARWLREAGRGEASPRWRALLAALVADDVEGVRAAAREVRRSGHTSGAFSLRGFLDTVAT